MFVNLFVQGFFQEFDFSNSFFVLVPGSPVTSVQKKTDVDFTGSKSAPGLAISFNSTFV